MRLAIIAVLIVGTILSGIVYGCGVQAQSRYSVILIGPDGGPRNIWQTGHVFYHDGFCRFTPLDRPESIAVSGTIIVHDITKLPPIPGVRQ